MWKKTGLFFDSFVSGNACSHAALPYAYHIKGADYKLFFSSRDINSSSHIYCVDMNMSQKKPMVDIGSIQHILAPGELGAFDDSGVMPSWIAKINNVLYLYYTGWSLGKTVPFYNFIGLAKSIDHGRTFERVSPAPIMGRSPIDPYLLNSPCVIKEHHIWKMWYVSGIEWKNTPVGPKHYYLIRYAESANGIDWAAHKEPCISFNADEEYAIARPCVVPVKDGYLMWYACRGTTYRLGFAASYNGITWKRLDHLSGLDVSATGWDSKMVAFAHVFKHNNTWWMLYNGNDYGKTGIGAASVNMIPNVADLM